LAKIVAFLDRAAQRGPATNPEQFRPIKGSSGLYEFKPKPFRVLCFFDGSRVIVCTHAFKKKEKIAAEIRFAERQKAEYFASKARGELRIEE
jgi:mRNA-degrading endonuclease RelE of RelBE toxin-antitoxin system